MNPKKSFITRLMEIESKSLAKDQGRWTEQAYLSEMESEEAEIFFWPSPEDFSAFVLYRVMPDKEVWIMNWATESKGQGIGSKVFQLFMRFCVDQNFNSIGLEVREKNLPAIKIYEKCGLKTVGRREKYYSNNEAALVFLAKLYN